MHTTYGNIIERSKGPTVSLSLRIGRDTAADLRQMSPGPRGLGSVIEKLVAAEMARMAERERLESVGAA